MHPNIHHLARLQHSFPLFDMLLRYKLSALEKPDVLAHLRGLMDLRQARILAVDLAS